MRIHKLTDRTEANGPGVRGLLHFQGCSLNCFGCFNKGTHSFTGKHTFTYEVTDWINRLDVEGITFSGGEPFQQYCSLKFLVNFIRAERPELSIGLFTGYSLRELYGCGWDTYADDKPVPGTCTMAEQVLNRLDFSVTGRYVVGKPSNQPLCSSSNQVLTLHSDRYSLDDFGPQRVELTVDGDSLVTTGFPSEGFRTGLQEAL